MSRPRETFHIRNETRGRYTTAQLRQYVKAASLGLYTERLPRYTVVFLSERGNRITRAHGWEAYHTGCDRRIVVVTRRLDSRWGRVANPMLGYLAQTTEMAPVHLLRVLAHELHHAASWSTTPNGGDETLGVSLNLYAYSTEEDERAMETAADTHADWVLSMIRGGA